MKNFLKILAACSVLASATSCEKFLDVNENQNSPTVATPDAILAQALATTASNYSTGYNHYGNFVAGFWGRSGTVNGYTEERTYNYTTAYQQGLFNNAYDNLLDYDLILKQGTGVSNYPNHAAIAKIMKAYNYQLLVDQYGDIPYTEALKGLANTSPKYDKADAIYKDLIVQLDAAIAEIKAVAGNANVRPVGAEDIVFRGIMPNWIRFANSLKLRILLRQSQTNDAVLNTYVRAEMTRVQVAAVTEGFITDDVVAQPGYLQTEGKQNPFYNRYGITSVATVAATERSYQLPTKYIIAEYLGARDPRLVRLYSSTATGFLGADLGEPTPIVGNRGSRMRLGGALLKAPDAPTPLMLLTEHLFSKSEAETRNLFTGGDAAAKIDYLAGVTASFVYFYRPAPSQRQQPIDSSAFVTTPNVPGSRIQSGKVARYLAANVANPKVNFDIAPSGANGKQEVIIYQKYLALNGVAAIDIWSDYRRTGLPKFRASIESTSPRPDKLPTRLLYPLSEVTSNPSNVPAGVTQYTKVFWDVVD